MTDKVAERSVQQCGELIARLRTARDWSRSKLIARLYREIDPDDPMCSVLSEAWLARLENGRMVKVPRSLLEALCRALRCSSYERVRVLMSADRNVLSIEDDADGEGVAALLSYAMEQLYREAPDILTSLLADRQAVALHEVELLEIIGTAIDLVVEERRASQL